MKRFLVILALLSFAMLLSLSVGMPKASANPDENTFYSTTSDGYMRGVSMSYSTAHDATTATTVYHTPPYRIGQRYYEGFYSISRAAIYFNTSSIPDNMTITGATLRIWVTYDWSTTDFAIVIQNGQPTYPHDSLVASDYYYANYSDNGGSLDTSSIGALNDLNNYRDIVLNAAGIGWINKAGTTKLMLRSSWDISSTPPSGEDYITFGYNSGLDIPQACRLVVTYENAQLPDAQYSENYHIDNLRTFTSAAGEWKTIENTSFYLDNTYTVHIDATGDIGEKTGFLNTNLRLTLDGTKVAGQRVQVSSAATWASVVKYRQMPNTYDGTGSAWDNGDHIYYLTTFDSIGYANPYFSRYSILAGDFALGQTPPRAVGAGASIVWIGGENYHYVNEVVHPPDQYDKAEVESWTSPITGTLRISFTMHANGVDYESAQVYRNGSPVGTERSSDGTWTENISGWTVGDNVEIWAAQGDGSTAGTVFDFAIYWSGGSDYLYVAFGGATAYFYKYTVATDTWTQKANIPASPGGDTMGVGDSMTWTGNDYIYVFHRTDAPDYGAGITIHEYRISTNAWHLLMEGSSDSWGLPLGASAWGGNNLIYFLVGLGGDTSGFCRAAVYPGVTVVVDVMALWPSMPGLSASLAWDGGSYVYGTRGGGKASFWRYSIQTDTWTVLTDIPSVIYPGGNLVYSTDNLWAVCGWVYGEWGNLSPTQFCFSVIPAYSTISMSKDNQLALGTHNILLQVWVPAGGNAVSRNSTVNVYAVLTAGSRGPQGENGNAEAALGVAIMFGLIGGIAGAGLWKRNGQ